MSKNRTPEAKAKEVVRLRANQWGARLFTNNTGVAYTEQGRPVFFGLGNDGVKDSESIRTPDDVGFTIVTITPEMVGKKIAVFTAIDAKKLGFVLKDTYPKGSREYGQKKFFDIVINANGIAGFASSAADVDILFNEFIQRVTK
jgi:hypothetical protein